MSIMLRSVPAALVFLLTAALLPGCVHSDQDHAAVVVLHDFLILLGIDVLGLERLVQLEAMAAGVPVVTSDRSALAEVAGDAALLVNPESVEAIAEALMAALPVGEEGNQLGQPPMGAGLNVSG